MNGSLQVPAALLPIRNPPCTPQSWSECF